MGARLCCSIIGACLVAAFLIGYCAAYTCNLYEVLDTSRSLTQLVPFHSTQQHRVLYCTVDYFGCIEPSTTIDSFAGNSQELWIHVFWRGMFDMGDLNDMIDEESYSFWGYKGAAILNLCAYYLLMALGALAGGLLSELLGPRKCLLLECLPVAVGSLCGWLVAITQTSPQVLVFWFAHRALLGFGCGMGLAVVSRYLFDVAPVNKKALISAIHPLFVALGTLSAHLLGSSTSFGTFASLQHLSDLYTMCRYGSMGKTANSTEELLSDDDDDDYEVSLVNVWKHCELLAGWTLTPPLVFPMVPLALGCILLLFGAESPAYIVRRKGQEEAARVLQKLRTSESKQTQELELSNLVLETQKAEARRRGPVLVWDHYKLPIRIAIYLNVCTVRVHKTLSYVPCVNDLCYEFKLL